MKALTTFRSLDGRFALRVPRKQLAQILAFCTEARRNETGGLLVGRYSADLVTATVYKVGSAPPDSQAGRTWFKRGIRGLTEWLESLWLKEDCYFIGEWHFHPYASPTPSSTDFNQMKRISKDPSWQCQTPMLLILGGDPRADWSLSAHCCPINEKPVSLHSPD